MSLQVIKPGYGKRAFEDTTAEIEWYASQLEELSSIEWLLSQASIIYKVEKFKRSERKVKIQNNLHFIGTIDV